MDYFYLGSSLPKLNTPDAIAEKDIESIQYHIYSQLEEEDQIQFRYLLYRNDNKNLLYILRKKEGILEDPYFNFHRPCFFSYQELEAGINGDHPLPGYMKYFLKKYPSVYEGRSAENDLIHFYYKEAIDSCGLFLSDYFAFKRNLKNIISAINARIFNYPLTDAWVGSGFVVETILKSNSSDLGLSNHFPFIEELTHLIRNNNLFELEKAVDNIMIQYLNSHTPLSPFSEEAIFLYFIKLIMGNRWVLLDENRGKEELTKTLDWVVSSANFPKEYARERN
jgi:hypothetical protein